MAKWVSSKAYEGYDRRNHAANRLIWTIMISACGLVAAGYTAWMLNLTSKIDTLQAMSLTREGHLGTLLSQVTDLRAQVNRLEDKVDRITNTVKFR